MTLDLGARDVTVNAHRLIRYLAPWSGFVNGAIDAAIYVQPPKRSISPKSERRATVLRHYSLDGTAHAKWRVTGLGVALDCFGLSWPSGAGLTWKPICLHGSRYVEYLEKYSSGLLLDNTLRGEPLSTGPGGFGGDRCFVVKGH